jgi:hypothetical protein
MTRLSEELHHDPLVLDAPRLRRAVAVVGLAGVALVHLLELPGQIKETAYVGVLFIGVIVAALAAAEWLIRADDPRAWLAAGGLALSVMAGYAVSRTTGLPAATEDVGNWLEPLGLASLFIEGLVVLLSVQTLRERARAGR